MQKLFMQTRIYIYTNKISEETTPLGKEVQQKQSLTFLY